MQVNKLSYLLPICLVSACSTHNQETVNWRYANPTINQLAPAMQSIKATEGTLPPFPLLVPRSATPLYATTEMDNSNDRHYWRIIAGNKPKCIVKGCIQGSLQAEANQSISATYKEAQGENAGFATHRKEKVILIRGISAYFTPGHAEADWHNPSLEWMQGQTHYTLTWEIADNAKMTLQAMANSGLLNK